jgi:hypothetical protein
MSYIAYDDDGSLHELNFDYLRVDDWQGYFKEQ